MASAQALDTVQKLYIGFYGRPADPAGLNYWAQMLDQAGGNVNAIINVFSDSAEYQSRFSGLSTTELVNNLYLQSFGRPAEPAGLNYWVSEIFAGNISLSELAMTLLDGAQNQDLQTIVNKLNVANQFTQTLESQSKGYNFEQIAAAKNLLDSVTSNNLPSGSVIQQTIAAFPTAEMPVDPPQSLDPGLLNYRIFNGSDGSERLEKSVKLGEDAILFGQGGDDYLRFTNSNDINSLTPKDISLVIMIGGEGSDYYELNNSSGISAFIINDGGVNGNNTVRIPVHFDDLYAVTLNGTRDLLLFDDDSIAVFLPDWQSPQNRMHTIILDDATYSYNNLVQAVNFYSAGERSYNQISPYIFPFVDHSTQDIANLVETARVLPSLTESQINDIISLQTEEFGVPSNVITDYLFG